MALRKSTNVDEVPGKCRRRRHRGADEMGAAAGALPALEIAVRRRRAALARLEAIVVHREAHRAARLAPLEPGVAKRAIEAFGLGLRLHQTRPRDHHCEAHAA